MAKREERRAAGVVPSEEAPPATASVQEFERERQERAALEAGIPRTRVEAIAGLLAGLKLERYEQAVPHLAETRRFVFELTGPAEVLDDFDRALLSQVGRTYP